jgi:hypothetical protein
VTFGASGVFDSGLPVYSVSLRDTERWRGTLWTLKKQIFFYADELNIFIDYGSARERWLARTPVCRRVGESCEYCYG